MGTPATGHKVPVPSSSHGHHFDSSSSVMPYRGCFHTAVRSSLIHKGGVGFSGVLQCMWLNFKFPTGMNKYTVIIIVVTVCNNTHCEHICLLIMDCSERNNVSFAKACPSVGVK